MQYFSKITKAASRAAGALLLAGMLAACARGGEIPRYKAAGVDGNGNITRSIQNGYKVFSEIKDNADLAFFFDTATGCALEKRRYQSYPSASVIVFDDFNCDKVVDAVRSGSVIDGNPSQYTFTGEQCPTAVAHAEYASGLRQLGVLR